MTLSYLLVLKLVALLVALLLGAVALGSTRVIREDESGLVIKRFGRPLPSGRIIALNGEAGFQPELGPNAFRGTLVALCAEWLMEQPNRIR